MVQGIDNLVSRHIDQLNGRALGVTCNQASVDRQGVHLLDRLLQHRGIEVVSIFVPEHGYRGQVAAGIQGRDETDPGSGIPIRSLGYVMQAAAELGIGFWILDRIPPLSGTRVDGPIVAEGFHSFVGLYPLPVRYGMSSGELARMIVGERWLASLTVVPNNVLQ